MKRILFLWQLFFFTAICSAQVSFNPEIFSSNEQMTLTYNAKGTPLEGASKVYIHAGAILDGPNSESWQNVVGNWGQDDGVGLMTESADDVWEITFVPDDYFGLDTENDIMYRMGFVFRNANGSVEGKNNGNDFFKDLEVEFSQVSFNPERFSQKDAFTLTFDATGSDLEGASKVYIHSGAVLDGYSSNSWSNVIGNWGQDDGVGQMTGLGNNKWEISITPSTYYGLNDLTQTMYRLAFVFRNADGSEKVDNGGTDFFYNLDIGFNFNLTAPSKDRTLLVQNEEFTIIANAEESVSWELFEEGISPAISVQNGSVFTYTISFDDTDTHNMILRATSGEEVKEAHFLFQGILPPEEADRPIVMGEPAKAGINYYPNDDSKVTLVLHTPTSTNYGYYQNGDTWVATNDNTGARTTPAKSIIYLIGSMNDWTVMEEYKLKRDGDYWWITLENLEASSEYAYQYLVDEDLRVADPYTEKIIDQDDRFIPSSTYPNLAPYPTGKTSFRISTFQTGQEEYVWQHAFTPPAKEDLNIYEMHIRDFVEEQSYDAAKERLDYLKDLGINCIELMPVNEFEGNNSWGYNPNFFFAVDKAYGTPTAFKEFVDAAHSKGMAVVLDIVFNHTFGSSPLSRLYNTDGAFGSPNDVNPWYNSSTPHEFDFGPDFNHESPHTQAFVVRALKHWLENYNIDGYRLDFTKGFTQKVGGGFFLDVRRSGMLQYYAKQVWEDYPDTYMIAEHLTDISEEEPLAQLGYMFWSGAELNHKYDKISEGRNENLSRAHFAVKGFSRPQFVSYMESHDEERMGHKAKLYGIGVNGSETEYATQEQLALMLPRLSNAAIFNMILPGPRMVWQFGELGYDVGINQKIVNGKIATGNFRVDPKPIRWDFVEDTYRSQLLKVYSVLLNTRLEYDLYTDENGNYTAGDVSRFSLNNSIKKIQLHGNDKKGNPVYLNVVGNMGSSNTSADPLLPVSGIWYNLLSGAQMNVDNHEDYRLDLEAEETIIMVNFDPSSLLDLEDNVRIDGGIVYEAPTLHIEVAAASFDKSELAVFRIDGSKIIAENVRVKNGRISRDIDLSSGVYVVALRDKVSGNTFIEKFNVN